MELKNAQVVHKTFGEGRIVQLDGSYVDVCFPCGNKRFVFPDAFGTFLKLTDPELSTQVSNLKQKVENERLEQQLEEEKIRIKEEERRQLMLEREKLMKSHTFSPASQAVFWCEEGEEDKIFSEWKVFTGLRKTSDNEEQPYRLVRLHHNSACLITAREKDEPEEQRRILGFFIVEPTFVGKLCEDGYVPAHPEYRVRLSDEESQKMLFWNYYYNKRYPNNITWNSGKHRYFENEWMAQIIKDIMDLKQDPKQREFIEEILQYFCHMNHLDISDLPEPSGALVRVAS